ncbi:hypothetical protein T484DRAFT_1928473 [Baffinella frigidus]|nr:hypothetical protein T484DRAFT_1928473 [Cryptophyta sp. CCMP2293]
MVWPPCLRALSALLLLAACTPALPEQQQRGGRWHQLSPTRLCAFAGPFPTLLTGDSREGATCLPLQARLRTAGSVAAVRVTRQLGGGAALRACSDEVREEDSIGSLEPTVPLQRGRKTIGVDYGLRRTGMCVSVGFAPRPLPLVVHKNDSALVAAEVGQAVRREGAEQVVVGMPLNTNGTEGEQANHTRVFIEQLRAASPATRIYLWDERYSSAIAKEKLKERGYSARDMKGMVDVVASIGILQEFFDKDGRGAELVHEPSAEDLSSIASKPSMAAVQTPAEWRAEMQRKAQAAAAAAPKPKKRKR